MALRVVPPIMQFAFALMCFHLLGGCNDRIVDPPLKNPREYTWTIDTLAYPGSFQTAMWDIWGSSPNDVYVVGHNDRAFGKMYHFDGHTWDPVKLHILEGGPLANIGRLNAIHGFEANNVWVVGSKTYYNPTPPPNFLDSSLIIRFDGRQWREHPVDGGRSLQAIFSHTPDDIWAAGAAGAVFHYDGTRWSKVPMDAQYDFFHMAGGLDKEQYLLGVRREGPLGDLTRGYRVLFRYDGNRWQAVDSVHVTEDGLYRIAVIGTTLYSFGWGIWALRGGVWQRELTTEAVLQGIDVVSSSNVFVVGQQSLIYHYDGQTWQQQLGIIGAGWWLSAVWATEREVFIVGSDEGGFKTIVLHGK